MIDPQLLFAEPPAAVARTDDPFQGYDFVVGGIWIAYLPSRENPRAVVSETFERQLDGRFLYAVMSQVMLSAVAAKVTQGYVGVDPEGLLIMRNFASDGSFAEGRQIGGTAHQNWVFAGRSVGETTVEWHNTLTKVGPHEIAIEIVFDPPHGPAQSFTMERFPASPRPSQ